MKKLSEHARDNEIYKTMQSRSNNSIIILNMHNTYAKYYYIRMRLWSVNKFSYTFWLTD